MDAATADTYMSDVLPRYGVLVSVTRNAYAYLGPSLEIQSVSG